MPKKAFSRDGTQAVWLRTPEGQIFAQIAFEKEGIERGEMVANPGLESAHISRVEAAAQHAYRSHFAAMRSPRPVRSSPSHSQDFPNVVLLVMESFRPDVVSPEIMPRLDQRSAQGLRARRHYSGSNTSHLGLCSLLYARSGLAYDAILDGPSSDHASLLFRELGYRTYFLSSGGIVGWRRVDEYLNQATFDEVEMLRSDSGQVWRDWPQNDRRLLEAARERLETAGQPVFIVGFLMSLHFPYPYPESQERFLPVSHEDQLADWPSLFAARLDRDKLWNRYRNAAIAFDAMLDQFLESIDLEKTLVVVTGDHGESFGEYGTLVHGSRPSDVQTRVPLVMLGGGVSAREIDGSTSHVDVLPTLLRIASGASSTGLGFEGRDLGGPIGDEPVLMRLHKVNEPAPVLIVHGDERLLLRARTDRPVLDAVGFVDANGTPVTDAGPVDDGRWTLVVQQALGGSAGSAQRR